MATVPSLQIRDRLVLYNVPWRDYSRFLRLFADRPGYRLTYDRGVLEIMSPSRPHDRLSRLLARIVGVIIDELGLDFSDGGSTTLRRRKKHKGAEPDESFWIVNEAKMRKDEDLDLRKDPPPDLCIEVDVTHSSLDRLAIYAALGVPEVWRVNDQGLTFHVLGANGYAPAPNSLAFPLVTPSELLDLLALREQMGVNALLRRVRAWFRKKLADAANS